MAKNKNGYRDNSRAINDPVRIERRMKLAHFFGLLDVEEELWQQLQEVKNNDSGTSKISYKHYL